MMGSKAKLSDEKFHYLIAVVALVSWLLHFAAKVDFYEIEEIYSGIIFIAITAPLYAVCIFIFYHFNGSDT